MSHDTKDDALGRSLHVLRAMIDSVDHEILHLLSRRNGLVAEVAAYKRDHRIEIRDRTRERELLDDRTTRAMPLGLQPSVIESIYRLVLWASRDRQASLKAEVPPDIEPRTVAIIGGHGGMGRQLATLFADLGHAVIVSDLDTSLSNEEAARSADVVIVSVPIKITLDVIREVGPHVREEALLTDVTSIKSTPVAAMLEHSRANVIGMHPLYGPSVHSLQGQRIVLTTGRVHDGSDWLDWMRMMLHARGLLVVETTPARHDQIMGVVQVLTHFSTEVLGRTLANLGVPLEETLQFTSPVYLMDMLLTARHFAQSSDLYAAIQMSNPRTPELTEAFVNAAREIRGIVDAKDTEAFARVFDEVGDFFGEFTSDALERSSYLIDRLVERS